MSEVENQVEAVEVEKSEAEQMAEVFAQKADKSDLEGFVKADAVEAVKAESIAAVEAAKSEILADVEAKLNQAPAFIKSEKEDAPMGYKFEEFVKGQESQLFLKAVNDTNSTTGTPVGASAAYADLVEGNPFRAMANVFAVASSSFKLPKLSGISGNKNEDAGSFTEGSSVTSATVNVDHYNTVARIAMPVVEDIPGLDGLVGPEMVREIAVEEHKSIITALDAASITEEDYTASSGAVLADISNLMGKLAPQYWSQADFIFSPEEWTRFQIAAQNGTGSPVVIDPVAGGFTLYGRPVMISGELDAGTSANDNPCYFGQWNRGLVIGSRMDVEMRRTDVESIGHITYWAEMRSGVAVRESAALVRLNGA